MVGFLTRMEIRQLKARARRLRLSIHRREGDLDCGVRVSEFIRPDLRRMKDEFNETMDRLAAIDPGAAAVWKKEDRL